MNQMPLPCVIDTTFLIAQYDDLYPEFASNWFDYRVSLHELVDNYEYS